MGHPEGCVKWGLQPCCWQNLTDTPQKWIQQEAAIRRGFFRTGRVWKSPGWYRVTTDCYPLEQTNNKQNVTVLKIKTLGRVRNYCSTLFVSQTGWKAVWARPSAVGLNCLTRNRILFFQSTILKMKINPGTSNSRKTCPQEAIEGKNQRCRSWWDSVSLLFSEMWKTNCPRFCKDS